MEKTKRKPTTPRPSQDFCIRWMIRRDMDDVLRIEREEFPDPWTPEEFIRAMQQRNCIGMVADDYCGDEAEYVAGYMIYELHKSKIVLLNFAVDGWKQRQGVGTAMMNKLKGKLSSQRRRSIEFKVAERNLDGQLFLKAMGFTCTGIFEGNFDDGADAYLFEYEV